MNATRGETTAFAVIVVLVAMITFSSNSNRPLFAGPSLPRDIPVNQAHSPKDGPGDGDSGSPALPSVSAAAPVLEDSFDRPNSTVVGPGWIEVEQTGASATIANSKLFFADTSDAVHQSLVRRGFDPVSTGTLQWDFDLHWARTGFDDGYELWMQLGDSARMVDPPSSNGAQFTGVGVDLRWENFTSSGHQSLVARQNSGGGSVKPLAVISGPTHLSVTVNLDLEPPKFSVTITNGTVGTVVINGLGFDDSGGVSKLDTVRFITNNLDETSFSGRTFDNVIISSFPQVS